MVIVMLAINNEFKCAFLFHQHQIVPYYIPSTKSSIRTNHDRLDALSSRKEGVGRIGLAQDLARRGSELALQNLLQ